MSDPGRIRISRDDVFSPRVDEILAREGSFGMRPGQFAARGEDKRAGLIGFLYSSIFYTGLAGALGAFLGWGLVEPFWGEEQISRMDPRNLRQVGWILMLTVSLWVATVGFAAAGIGGVEGVVSRNWSRAVVGAMIGLGIGAVGAVLLFIPCVLIYRLLCDVAGMIGDVPQVRGRYDFRRANTIAQMALLLARGLAWAPMGIVVGLAPALHMRSKRLAFNGLVGGLVGAFLGGLLFNPICQIFKADEAWLSRCCGFTLIGLGAGMLIGLVENLAKSAWIHVQAGALAGKQFVLYKNPTVLGSSPKCEIFLFKDEDIEPKHAAIHQYGNRYEIEDLDSPAGTFVNGRKITRQPLKNGDRIYLGETVLDFSEKESD
jgi:FHA domain